MPVKLRFKDFSSIFQPAHQSIFHLQELNHECHFGFTANFDLNHKGTISIVFNSQRKCRAFISDTLSKPDEHNADMVIEPNSEEPVKYFPPNPPPRDELFQDKLVSRLPGVNNMPHSRMVYVTIRTDDDSAYGRL